MSSPEVWTAVRDIIEAALPGLGCTAAWPNEAFALPEPPAPFIAVEMHGDLSRPIELGGGVWQEDGTAYLHVMIPTGAGITTGNEIRKALANLFRGVVVGALAFRDIRYDPLGVADDDGNYLPLSLAVTYIFQDR